MIVKNVLYFFTLLLLPFYAFAEETLQKKIQNILNDKTIEDPFKRFASANDTLVKYHADLPFEEAMFLWKDVILPFVEKNVKDERQRYGTKSLICTNMAMVHSYRGNPEDYANHEAFNKKAVEYADLSGYATRRADAYNQYGRTLSNMGNIPLAHEYFYKAINLFESLHNYVYLFDCLYNIAENLLQARDAAGLGKVVEQMQYYMEKPEFDGRPDCFYDFYSVQGAYYGILSEDNPETTAYNDSTLMADRNVIRVYENNREKFGESIAAGFAYYNMSLTYRKCYPDRYDSIYYFLNKALEIRQNVKMVATELEICVYISYAELHFEQKRYQQAEKDMLYALSLLEQVQDDNTASEYTEAYKFLVMFYETMKRPDEALKYYKLLLENEKKRYDNEKIMAMDDMLVKYETEKKKEQIDRLTERHKTAQKTLALTISLIVVLAAGLLVVVRLNKFRKKNYELSIYEAALLAELKQNELEQIKQRLEQKPTKTIIGKLTEWVSESNIEQTKKDAYTQQLAELDVEMMEQGYLTSNEKISNMDMKYIICFAIDMDVKDMSLLFNVEPASIRSVRYRIKKKFGEKNTFKFLM